METEQRGDLRGDLLQSHGAQQGQRPKSASGGTDLLRPRRDRDPGDAVHRHPEPPDRKRNHSDPDRERERDFVAVDIGDRHKVQRVAADVAGNVAQRGAVLRARPSLRVLDAETAVADADVGERHFALVRREQVVQPAEDFRGVVVGVVAERDEVELSEPRRC